MSVLLPACRNLRDLGGLPTRTGGRVRHGVLFRSGSPHDAEPSALAEIRRCVTTLIDLRRLDEAAFFCLPELAGTIYVSAPFETGGVGSLEEAERPASLLESYLHIALGSAEEIVRVFDVLADAGNLPALVFCAAGKDRTGVIVALVLATLEVSDEDIVIDYAKTGLIDPATFDGVYAERLALLPDWLRSSPPATMETFLTELRTEFGSIHGFLLASGVSDRTIDAVRRNLLES